MRGRMDDFDRNWRRHNIVFVVIACVVITLTIAGYTMATLFGIKLYNAVDKNGLNSVINRVLEGDKLDGKGMR